MDFVGRAEELAFLNDAWSSGESAFIPVYGRRRIGKSELILKFCEGKDAIYLLGKLTAGPLQIREFMQLGAQLLNEPLLAEVTVERWKRAFELVLDRWPAGRKLAIVFDEFQWMVSASPDLPSVLQELWDRRMRDDGRFMLILCGSQVGFMEREVLGEKSPLFGRRTGLIHLQPFGFREARLFHPNYSLRNAARTYFVCGGVAAYLRAFKGNQSVEENIRSTILDQFGALFLEPQFLLREELREVQNYFAILMALASGSHPPREIARTAGIPEGSIFYYLDQLVGLRYVEKKLPLVGGKPNARHVRYALDDPLLRFWFRFVYPNQSELRQSGPEKMFANRIKPQLPAWCGLAFEKLCREALPQLYEDEGLTAAWEVGEYWNKDVQIDLVGLREDHWTDIGECKWGTVRSAPALVTELRSKAEKYPNKRNATLGLRAFVRQMPSNPDDSIRWHSLEDLYGVDR